MVVFDDDDDSDDYPGTHLDDDAYDEFLAKEFDRKGGLREGPRFGLSIELWIGLLTAIAIAIALAVAL